MCAQSCPTLCDPMDCSLPGSSVHGIFLARILEWVVMPSSRGSSQPRDRTCFSWVSCIGRCILYRWADWEAIIYVERVCNPKRVIYLKVAKRLAHKCSHKIEMKKKWPNMYFEMKRSCVHEGCTGLRFKMPGLKSQLYPSLGRELPCIALYFGIHFYIL